MDEHLFYLLGKYKDAGSIGIIWETEAQIIMQNYEYQRLFRNSKVDSRDIGVFLIQYTTAETFMNDDFITQIRNSISEKGDYAYQIEKSIRDQANQVLKKENLVKEQIMQVNQSVIDTNKSFIRLNEKTDLFYENQNRYNTIQKKLTIWIMLSAVVSALATIFSFYNNNHINDTIHKSEIQQLQKKNYLLDSTLQSQIKINTIVQKNIIDSLKIKSKN